MRVRSLRGGVVGAIMIGAMIGAMIGMASPAVAATVPFGTVPLDRWDTNGKVYATKIVGGTVYIGGSFSQVRSPSGATSTRTNLAALNIATGDVLSFRADTNGVVRALEGDATTVWVGGAFTTIGGASRSRLAAVSASSGSVRTTFSANASSTVYALERGGSNLYVGGAFGSIKGVANPRLAAVDPASGAVRTAFRPAPNNTVQALVMSPKADRLYAGGSFTAIGGRTRSYISAVNPSTGVASGPTMASASGRGMGLDISADGLSLFGALGDTANRVIAWNTSTGARRWYQVANGDVQALKYYGGNVYFGFHEGFAGDTTVRLLAADAGTGKLEAFRPTVNSFYGVWALDATDRALVAGGEFTKVSGVPTQGVAIFPA
jgi:hypothetical protein